MSERGPELLDAVLDRQKDAWDHGRRLPIEDFLTEASLQNDADALLDLIYNEILLREELGEAPDVEEYIGRYPHLADELKLHFEVHRAIHDKVLIDTRRLQPSGTLTDPLPLGQDVTAALDDYEILGELGQGGMGIVYKARQRGLKRVVALKMIHPGHMPSARVLDRFRAEAETIARLQHPNIVQIFEVGQAQGLPFLALEMAEGGTLATKLRDFSFAPRQAAELIDTLARAMHYAHQQHVVHRDLKPANVLFAKDGTPKITDFGLAKVLEDDPDSPRDPTRTGEPIGTPRYMSPEQVAGQSGQIGPATDVYALGALLYECMTGQAPFVAPKVMETMEKIRHDDPMPPRRLQPAIPRDLETICLTCLHKEPSRRYATALALAEDVQRFLRGEAIAARPTPVWERWWKWARRRPAQAALWAVGVVLLVAGVAGFFFFQHLEKQRVADLRNEVAILVKEGQDSLARQEIAKAKDKFLAALGKIQAEPALRDHELAVRGWLDHSLRDAEQQRLKQRRPPPLFDERYGDAVVQCALVDLKEPESVQRARQAFAAARALTAGDPALQSEREELVLLDADLALQSGDAKTALDILDRNAAASRPWHGWRAEALARLGRAGEAEQATRQYRAFPHTAVLEALLAGVDFLYRRDNGEAVLRFETVLNLQPDHVGARFLQAVCFLHLKRPGEAKVALTACLGQRPHCEWSVFFRGLASLQLGEYSDAAHDFHRALDMKNQAEFHHQAIDLLKHALKLLPGNKREAVWAAQVDTKDGMRPLREIPAFAELARSLHR